MLGEARSLLTPLAAALYDGDDAAIAKAIDTAFVPDATVHLCHPLGDLTPTGLAEIYAALRRAMPDLERREWIRMAGQDDHGHLWVGSGATLIGTFAAPWLDIPPTGHLAHMRCHDFFRIEGGRIVEMQALWDIPELMMQAKAWPLAPSLGRDWHVPGPATCDGLGPHGANGIETRDTIKTMLDHMKRHPSQGGPEVMEMERFWHPRMTWYGPAGIGTGRGIAGFRNWHQIPFLAAMPDRGQYVEDITYHFFGEGDYAAVTGWPNMIQTITDPGWLGIAPAGQRVTMRSLDFWRLERGLIRENWVLVDLLDVLDQVGIDALARMREFNKARPGFDPDTGHAL
ncbi:ester cyclase [Pontivivens ytuae]|uniref:Ester cyclase n=1 Tax=Pontivivens ytuae TaxID=2789856 RepID=A0A7S9LS11_9RHOB|nr:ester cyclase [Pontivivens ytuae]QPH53670.1 ester cyclase [Pontivivens ytuae]